MFITPNSDIFVLHGVPLDPSYDHTIYFASGTEQYNYFNSRAKYRFTNQYYQRHGRNYVRVQQLADNMYDCNYLMFRNTSFGLRWFYAFILSINYINNNVSEIEYQIDVMQTWAFDYTLNPSWVIREHVDDDTIGLHTEPESLNIGPMLYTDLGDIIYSSSRLGAQLKAVVACTIDQNYDDYAGGMYCGLFSAINYIDFSLLDGGTSLANWLEGAVNANKGESILNIFLVPSVMIPVGSSAVTLSKTFTKNTAWKVNGYPKNNKIYTYPYNYLYITNNNGNSADYAWERFSSPGVAMFELKGVLNTLPEMSLTPILYDGVADANFNERLFLQEFPEVSWSNDFFKAWLAGYGRIEIASDVQGLANGAVKAAVSASSGDALTAGTSVGNALYDGLEILNKMAVYDSMPRQLKGRSTNALNIDWESATSTTGEDTLVGFRAYNVRIKDEYMLKIDDFFSRFGYTTNRLKIPNRYVRENWTYTRTADCTITAGNTGGGDGLPGDDEKTICSIYNRGITFWRVPANVGNYSLSNLPLSAVQV